MSSDSGRMVDYTTAKGKQSKALIYRQDSYDLYTRDSVKLVHAAGVYAEYIPPKEAPRTFPKTSQTHDSKPVAKKAKQAPVKLAMPRLLNVLVLVLFIVIADLLLIGNWLIK